MPLGTFEDSSRVNHALLREAHYPIHIDLSQDCRSSSSSNGPSFRWNPATIPFAISNATAESAAEAKPSKSKEAREGRGGCATYAFLFTLVLCLWSSFAFLLFFLYFNLSSTMTAYKEELRPHIHELAGHVASVLRNVDSVTMSAQHMLANADSLESSVIPTVSHAVNDTAHIIEKLERISRNPVVKLSLS